VREDNDRGFVDASGNELTVGSTVDDPAAIRVASPAGTNKISGNVLNPDGSQSEKNLLILTMDESGGCYDFQAQLPGRTDDNGMVRLARLSPKGFELFVPIIHSPMPTIPPAPPDGSDPTHGIPPGDFARIVQVYGFESDQQQEWAMQRVTSWAVVIGRMDERDDFTHFPKTPQAPPVMTPEERGERLLDVEALIEEWPGMDLNNADSFLAGRSSLREFHNDNQDRAGVCRPEFHRPGRPYES